MGFTSFHNDHGLLGGLSDDDHTQYVLRNILTTDGDLFSRSSGSVTRIAAVASGQVLTSAGTGTLPAWSATPTLTSVTCPTLNGGTAANDDITIQGTTHATRTSSYVLLQPSGGNVGIATTGPGYLLDVNGKLRSNRYILGTGPDLSLIPVEGGQSVLSCWWGLQLIGNRQLDVDYTPSNYGAGGAFSVIIPNQMPGAIGLVLRAAASQTANIMQWQDSGGTVLGSIDSSGNVGLGTDTPVISGTGKLHMAADTFRLATARTPATAGAAGNAGDICWDASFIYVCTATNAWERAAIASW